MPPGLADQRKGGDFDVPTHVIQPLEPHIAMRRPLLGQGNQKWTRLRRKRRALFICSDEGLCPFVCGEFPRFLEPPSQNHLGRLIIEEEGSRRVNDDDRHGKIACELPGKNHFNLFLGHGTLLPERTAAAWLLSLLFSRASQALVSINTTRIFCLSLESLPGAC